MTIKTITIKHLIISNVVQTSANRLTIISMERLTSSNAFPTSSNEFPTEFWIDVMLF